MNIFTSTVKTLVRPVVPNTLGLIGTRALSTKILPDIPIEEVKQKIKEPNTVLIDCRTEEEYRDEGYVRGFVNIPIKPFGNIMLLPDNEFKERTGMKKPKTDDEIVIMCLLGIRARTCQLALMGLGYENVRMYKGSFKEWRDKSEEIVYVDKK